MPQITANGLSLEYDEHGNAGDPPIVMIMGLGAQMTLWPIELVEALAERGFRVIRFDNRDIGLSHKFDGARAPGVAMQVIRKRLGFPARVPYTLTDMADDAAGVMDALGIDTAHIVGGSMGGMIAQLVAVNHPDRVRSLTSIFSTTGHGKLPQARKEALSALTKRPESLDEEVLIAHGVMVQQAIGSPGYRPDPERQRARVRDTIRRSIYPEGMVRQMAAIIDDGDRTDRLRGVTAPTLVLHGEDDPLVRVEGGRATAEAIPGARIRTIPGWGHDIPDALVETIADEIASHAKAADAAK